MCTQVAHSGSRRRSRGSLGPPASDSDEDTDTAVTRTIVRPPRRRAGRPKRKLNNVIPHKAVPRPPLNPISRPGVWGTYCGDDELEQETAMLQANVAKALSKATPNFDDIYNQDSNLPDGHVLPNGIKVSSQWLRFTPRSLEKEGYIAQTIRIADIPKVVDSSSWQWQIYKATVSDHVYIQWRDPAGLRPGDFRARRFSARVRNPPDASMMKRIVFRFTLRCNQLCRAFGDPADLRVGRNFRAKDPKEDDSTCYAKMEFIATVADALAGRCTMWQLPEDKHTRPPDGSNDSLSHHVRAQLHQMASTYDMTPSALADSWDTATQGSLYRAFLQEHAPKKLPGGSHFELAVRRAREKGRLDRDPLVAIRKLVSMGWGEIFHYRLEQPMMCCMATGFTIDAAILYSGLRGIYMDASWRNKNADRCPMTIVLTVDEKLHGVPIAVMVSAQATSVTYAEFLEALRRQVIRRARYLVEGRVQPSTAFHEHERVRLMENARAISQTKDWKPSHAMIDGDDAERNALERVFEGIAVRVCQFHLMRACKLYFAKVFGAAAIRTGAVRKAASALARCQRCPDVNEWPTYYARFRTAIQKLSSNEQHWTKIDGYLKKEWFSDRWRAAACDYGLPPHRVRSWGVNTNNHAESMFQLFDKKILHCRKNKRLDRLIIIICTFFFQSFEALRDRPYRANAEYEAMDQGFAIWSGGLIRPPNEDDPSIPPELQRVLMVSAGYDDNVYCTGVHPSGHRPRCDCRHFTMTGKFCSHLWARYFYNQCGGHREFDLELEELYPLVSDIKVVVQRPVGLVDGVTNVTELDVPADEKELKRKSRGPNPEDSDRETGSSEGNQRKISHPAKKRKTVAHKPGPAARPTGIRQERAHPQQPLPGYDPETIRGVTKPVGTANVNLRSCWLNSLLLVLNQSSEIKRRLARTLEATRKAPLKRALNLVMQHLSCLDSRLCHDPSELVEHLESVKGFGLTAGDQNDPNLFLAALATTLYKGAKQDRLSTCLFQLSLVEHQCTKCGPVSAVNEQELFTTLHPVSGANTVSDLLFRSAVDQVAFTCNRCGRAHDAALRTVRLLTAPQVLWTTVVWPTEPDGRRILSPTITQRVYPEDTLRVKAVRQEAVSYRFAGALVRSGRLTSLGHYLAVIGRQGSYWVANDDIVYHRQSLDTLYDDDYLPTAFFYVQDRPLCIEEPDPVVASTEPLSTEAVGRITHPRPFAEPSPEQTSPGTTSSGPFTAAPPHPVSPTAEDVVIDDTTTIDCPTLATVIAAESDVSRLRQPSDPGAPLTKAVPKARPASQPTPGHSVNPAKDAGSAWRGKLGNWTWVLRLSKYLLKGEWNERQWILRAAIESLHRRQLYYARPTAFGCALSAVPPRSTTDELCSHLRHLLVVPEVARFLSSALGAVPKSDSVSKWYRKMVLCPEEWYTNLFVSDYFRILFNVLKRQNGGRMSRYRLLSQDVGTRVLLGDGEMNLDGFGPRRPGGLLFHELLRDTAEWRRMVTVAPMLVKTNPGHFGTLVIYGEEKLVVWYDGSGGHLAADELERTVLAAMRLRMTQEVEQGLARKLDNEGWEALQNHRSTREAMQCPEQSDIHSCGPLAIAAGSMVLQGFVPTSSRMLVRPGSLRPEDAVALRFNQFCQLIAMLHVGSGACSDTLFRTQDGELVRHLVNVHVQTLQDV